MNRNTFLLRRAAPVALFGAMLLQDWSCRGALAPLYSPAPPPAADRVFSSTGEVTSLFLDGDALWAATGGGLLLRTNDGAWRKFTTRDGLPCHEIRAFRKDATGLVVAQTPRGEAIFDGERWTPIAPGKNAAKPGSSVPRVTASALWRGAPIEATFSGLRFDTPPREAAPSQKQRDSDSAQVQILALPGGVGTHVSALLPRERDVCAALFGDGLWLTDGKKWNPAPASLQVPDEAREITALAGDKTPQWVGTRRAGIWRREGESWRQNLQPDEPFAHNAQAMLVFKGALFVSTLEDGLSVRTGAGWRHANAETLSSNAPRQMVPFQNTLFVRHGGGQIDSFDGSAWHKNVFATLPRQKALAIAADRERLFAGQWGGWSEWNGRVWQHFLNLPALQGIPPMALLPDGDTLWFATQSRGIAEIERATGKIRWHDERLGLPDDWITCLAKVGTEIFAGTFVGGLARWDGLKWQVAPEFGGECVTALDSDGAGGLYVATRKGVWHRDAKGKLQPMRERAPWLEPEAQALCVVPEGLWIGTRTGIFYLKSDTDSRSDA